MFGTSHPDRVSQNAVVNQVITAAFLFVSQKASQYFM